MWHPHLTQHKIFLAESSGAAIVVMPIILGTVGHPEPTEQAKPDSKL